FLSSTPNPAGSIREERQDATDNIRMSPRPYNRKLRQALGWRIRQRRKELGWSQRCLKDVANLPSQRQVWDIEHGQAGMTIETARRVAHALRWSLSRLFKDL